MKALTTNSLATLAERSSGELILAGQLDYRNGKSLCDLGCSLIKKSSAKTFMLDCSGVTRTSSVGVSLILSLIRDAKVSGKTLIIKTLTTDLDVIAKFSGISEILPLASDFNVVNIKK